MGNPKQKWTQEEEDALVAGVAKHGTGKWKDIQRDPEFNRFLLTRSNIDLKDKWRNMTAGSGAQGSRDRTRTPKSRPNSSNPTPPPVPALPAPPTQEVLGSAPGDHSTTVAASGVVNDESVKGNSVPEHGKTAPKYGELIFQAIEASNDPNGLEISAIIKFIGEKEELPQNFRRPLSDKLRRLVAQEKLEKVQNRYKAKNSFETKTPTPLQVVRPKHIQSTNPINIGETLDEAAVTVAYRIAEAENKSFVAAEAVKEAERVAKIAEDTALLLQIAEEIFEKCSRGEVVTLR